jgi:hypothetical protein
LLIGWIITLGAIAVAVLVLRLIQRRFPRFERLIAVASGEQDAGELAIDRRQGSLFWWIAGAIFLVAAFAFLELRQPYYFTQDDALVAELPGMLSGCRSVWHGVWPDYDPSRLMGGPLASEGVYSLTYPPTYLAYAIARHLLRNENALLDVFAGLHLAAGYVATTWLCRRAGMRPMIACCAALSFLLSGSILIMGRGWHTFVPIVVWMPLLMAAVVRLAEGPVSWRWAVWTGLASGIFFHVGFPQVWVYAMLLTGCALLFLLLSGTISLRRLRSAWPAGAIALGIAAPLLLPQLAASNGVLRPPLNATGITSQWIAALLPYPLAQVAHPMGWGSTDAQLMGHFVYFGTIFALLEVVGFLAVLSRFSRQAWGRNVWIGCAAIALLFTTGDRGLLFSALAKLPLIGQVNNDPFRALPFFVLFAVVGGGIFAERALRSTSFNTKWMNTIAALALAPLAYHVLMARPSFYSYGFKPFPTIASTIAKRIEALPTARIVSWTPKRSTSPAFAATLPLNLPMLYGIPAFSGYDPLLEWGASFREAERRLSDQPIEALRAYGVRWHLLSALLHKPILSNNVGVNGEEKSVRDKEVLKIIEPSLHITAHTDAMRLGELDGVSPMAFPQQQANLPLPITAGGDGVRVDLLQWPAGGNVVVNFLWHPQMQATTDDKPTIVSHDDWQRMVIDVPAGAKSLHIRYAAGWTKGLLLGGVLVLIGLGGCATMRW